MSNIKHHNLNEPVKDMFEISNNEFHNLTFVSLKPILLKKALAILGLYNGTICQWQQKNRE